MIIVTRRNLLAAGGGLAAAAALGALAGRVDFGRDFRAGGLPHAAAPRATTTQLSPASPDWADSSRLAGSLRREQTLIAAVDAALAADPTRPSRLDNIRSDHVAHATAIRDALVTIRATGGESGPSIGATAVGPTSSAAPLADLLAAEQGAHTAAAADSASLRGANAVLLASIAACEAGHLVLLS